MWTGGELKAKAKSVLKMNYRQTVLVFFLYILIIGGVGTSLAITLIGPLIISVFLGHPMEVGLCHYSLGNRKNEGDLEDLIYAFRPGLGNIIWVSFLKMLIITLWFLLFLVPGFIKLYEYRMVYFLLSENPELCFHQALDRSARMMKGEKWRVFKLDLSFIGWRLLVFLTLGIADFLFVKPYIFGTEAELYEALKEKTGISGTTDPDKMTVLS